MKKHEYLEGAVEHAVHAGHEADELQRRRRNAKSESERERQRGERERGRERERENKSESARFLLQALQPRPSESQPTTVSAAISERHQQNPSLQRALLTLNPPL